MIKKTEKQSQISMFFSLKDTLDQKHPLFILAEKINWQQFEEAFTPLYCSDNGRPALAIRLMVGLLILKHLRNISDESVVEQFSENIYYQYLCGQNEFTARKACEASELVHFRNRIGEQGVELILQESIRINDQDRFDPDVSIDTTVQEKNITYPTDNKLHRKIITKCKAIAEKEDKDKIYSIHEPEVECISKGKESKKYEFGNKVSLITTQTTGVIVGAMSFRNPYDGHTLPSAIEQAERLLGKASIKTATVDRGYRGVSKINGVIILSPKPFNDKTQTKYKQNKLKKQFGRRAAIEPIIGHLKSDHRMRRNYYKGITGDSINVMLSAAAFNFKRMMRKWSSYFWFYIYRSIILPIRFVISQITDSQKEIWVFKGRLFKIVKSIFTKDIIKKTLLTVQSFITSQIDCVFTITHLNNISTNNFRRVSYEKSIFS